jgi:hypothetical protein
MTSDKGMEHRCNRRGIRVECVVCLSTKQPRGRSAPLGASYCNSDCSGYYADPWPGDLWPGETCEELGYHHGANATEEITR